MIQNITDSVMNSHIFRIGVSFMRCSLLKSHIYRIDFLQPFQSVNDLQSLLNRLFLDFQSNYFFLVVDVSKHYRFCDEFSHLIMDVFSNAQFSVEVSYPYN